MDIITSEVYASENAIGQILLSWCKWSRHDEAIFQLHRFIAGKDLAPHTQTHMRHTQASLFSQQMHNYH